MARKKGSISSKTIVIRDIVRRYLAHHPAANAVDVQAALVKHNIHLQPNSIEYHINEIYSQWRESDKDLPDLLRQTRFSLQQRIIERREMAELPPPSRVSTIEKYDANDNFIGKDVRKSINADDWRKAMYKQVDDLEAEYREFLTNPKALKYLALPDAPEWEDNLPDIAGELQQGHLWKD